jgi:hypothetical protein
MRLACFPELVLNLKVAPRQNWRLVAFALLTV